MYGSELLTCFAWTYVHVFMKACLYNGGVVCVQSVGCPVLIVYEILYMCWTYSGVALSKNGALSMCNFRVCVCL